eukprot:TRINITY_DN82218_c0_g1_i1.p1 TRINITY_DN82218_c0_g1~~TRINITY_DN82218_c0_g1_i1.p1  ORF type:complete len:359 (-),score=60.47 TRINITY_DN82218_c0_g1_i1:22-1098(-)
MSWLQALDNTPSTATVVGQLSVVAVQGLDFATSNLPIMDDHANHEQLIDFQMEKFKRSYASDTKTACRLYAIFIAGLVVLANVWYCNSVLSMLITLCMFLMVVGIHGQMQDAQVGLHGYCIVCMLCTLFSICGAWLVYSCMPLVLKFEEFMPADIKGAHVCDNDWQNHITGVYFQDGILGNGQGPFRFSVKDCLRHTDFHNDDIRGLAISHAWTPCTFEVVPLLHCAADQGHHCTACAWAIASDAFPKHLNCGPDSEICGFPVSFARLAPQASEPEAEQEFAKHMQEAAKFFSVDGSLAPMLRVDEDPVMARTKADVGFGIWVMLVLLTVPVPLAGCYYAGVQRAKQDSDGAYVMAPS